MARSTRRDDWPGRESEGGRVVLALILSLALLSGGAYAAAYVAARDRVPVGARVAGVDIGGRSPASAEQVLRDGLAARASQPFTVLVAGHTRRVRPAQVGLAVDYAASVRRAGAERGWHPSQLWSYFTDSTSYQPVVTLDQGRLGRLLTRLDVADGRTPTDGGVVFGRHGFRVLRPRPGLTVDPRAAGTAFWNAYLSGEPSVQLTLMPVSPAIGAGAVGRFVRRFANPAMAGGVELRFGPSALRLQPTAYGRLLVARRVGNHLRPWVRAGALARLTSGQLSHADTGRPRAATVALVNGRPHVVKARPGLTYHPREVASALIRAIASPRRTATVRPTVATASFTDADARHLGIRQQVAWFTARVPRGSHGARLAAAARRLDGTVLHPGQALSLRRLLGGSTPAGPGGDALATAVFNAAWLAGLQVRAHAAHPTFPGSGPLGRDATLAGGQDLSFTDDTAYGVLVSAVAGRPTPSHHGTVTVTLWSTPRWTVTTRHSPRRHVVPAGRQVDHGAGCTPRPGQDGFEVTVTRALSRGGHVAGRTSYTVTYAPVAAVVCRTHHHRHHG